MDHGIDLSHWQIPAYLDWPKIASQQTFVIVRATYGTRSDMHFRTHIASARKAGLLVGAYHFYRQSQPMEAQLSAFFGELEAVGFGKDDILPVVDLEYNEKNDGKMRPATFNTEARAMIERIEAEFGGCYVYVSPGFFRDLGSPVWMLRHPWWVAHHTTKSVPDCPKEWDIWQYTGTGRIDGYNPKYPHESEDIDCNRAKLIQLVHGEPNVSENDQAEQINDASLGDDAGEALEQIAKGLDQVSGGLRLLSSAAKGTK